MNELKQIIKNGLMFLIRKVLIIIIPVIIILALIPGLIYYITVDDGTYKEGNKKSVSYVASKNISSVSISSSGLSTEKSAEELWNQMKSDDAPVDQYLDSYEELQKLMNAEIVTQYPKIGSGDLDGKIEFQRIKNDNNTQKMKYIEKEKFEQLKEDCEVNGNTDVLNYFTLDDDSNIIVAALKTVKETINTTDVDINIADYTNSELNKIDDNTYEKNNYVVEEKKINYKNAVRKYKMSFKYLWSLLVITEDKDFVLGLADLADKTQILIGIYDNDTTTVTKEEYTYTKQKRTDTFVRLNIKDNLGVTGYDTERYWLAEDSPNASENYNSNYKADYEEITENVTYTKETVGSKISTNIDKVDSWIVKSECTNQQSEETQNNQSNNVVELDNTEFEELSNSPETSEENSSLFSNKNAEEFKTEINNYIVNNANTEENENSENNENLVDIDKVECRYFINLINRKKNSETVSKTIKNVQTITSKEMKDDPDSKEENFVTLLNKNGKAKDSVNEISGWLYELLETNELNDSTLNMVDLTKYLIAKSNYEKVSFDFSIFEESTFNGVTTASSGSAKSLLKEYIHSWEGCTELSSDGTKYKIEDDGAGHPTVGWGIDIENSGYKSLFEENNYPTTIGGWVDKDFVDALEEDEISSKWDAVKSMTSDLNLKDYQINALVSRAYNMGLGGALTTRRGSDGYTFNEAYKAYWNQENDDKFDAKDENAVDYNNKLYTEYMQEVVTSGGQVLNGLIKRRQSEWKLFQTGYYDRIDKWHSGGNGDILSIADQVHQEEIDWSYYVNSSDLYWNNIEMSINNPNKATCCATYVSCVLYRAGLYSESEMNSFNYNECTALFNFLKNAGWSEISSYDDLEAGDIVFMNYNDGGKDYDHVQIYAGEDTWYNAGDTSAIRRASPYKQGSWARDNFFVALRLNN